MCIRDRADDYVVKPFSPCELVARVRAVLARTMRRDGQNAGSFAFGGLVIDTASHTVTIDGAAVALTPKEFDLLVFLAAHKGIALSREKILQQVWNYDYFGEDRTVDTHVKMLRGHLGKYRDFITTVWGLSLIHILCNGRRDILPETEQCCGFWARHAGHAVPVRRGASAQ